MAAEIIDFAEARAAKLREEDSNLGRIFRELDAGPKLRDITTEQLIQWAVRLHGAKDSDTMASICEDIERIIEGRR